MNNIETKNKLKNNLKEVIEVCVDSSKGYEKAAEYIGNEDMKTIFNRLAQQRKLFIEELNTDAIKDLGIEFDTSAPVSGYFHDNWVESESKLKDRDDTEIMKEAVSGEENSLKVYNEAIQSVGMPDYISEKLKDQRSLIEGTKKQLHNLKAVEEEVN